jgi:hypothetical protein
VSQCLKLQKKKGRKKENNHKIDVATITNYWHSTDGRCVRRRPRVAMVRFKRVATTTMPSSSGIEGHGTTSQCQEVIKKSDVDDAPFTPPLEPSLPSTNEDLSPCFARRRSSSSSNMSPQTSRFLYGEFSSSLMVLAEQDLWLPDLNNKSNMSSSRKIMLRPRFSPMSSETIRSAIEEEEEGIFDERDRGMIFRHVMDESSSLRFPSLPLFLDD